LLTRYQPAEDLRLFIEHFWVIHWDLRGQAPYRQVVLSHPNVNMVFEKGNTRIYGIVKTTSSQLLKDDGVVLGVKFMPGGFYPFWNMPASKLTGHSISFREMFGTEDQALEEEILALEDGKRMVELAEHFFHQRLPEWDANVELVNRIVKAISEDRGITKVDDLVCRLSINKRTVQRLFSRYVGVTPKWVIQRYRLHEAAELIEKGQMLDWPKLSLDLGYFDQAHFIKDFKAIIGRSPEEYIREIGSV
jgi:AraC-like DNA-binding protein